MGYSIYENPFYIFSFLFSAVFVIASLRIKYGIVSGTNIQCTCPTTLPCEKRKVVWYDVSYKPRSTGVAEHRLDCLVLWASYIFRCILRFDPAQLLSFFPYGDKATMPEVQPHPDPSQGGRKYGAFQMVPRSINHSCI